MNIYDFTVETQDGREVALASLQGKVILVVNTATGCGFTPQYAELQEMYDEFAGQGLEILDFPCNQFANQAPGEDQEIHDFCTGRYGITFPQYHKVDVNGEDAIPLYKWLTSSTTFQGFNGPAKLFLTPLAKKMDPDYKNNGNIKWNFTKFLIGRDGSIVARYEPTAKIDDIKEKVRGIL